MPILGVTEGVPSGSIAIWTGIISSIPTGWKLCDGTDGTPNLRNRFPKCVPTVGTNPGSTGGQAEVTLTITNMNTHRHTFTIADHEHGGGLSEKSEGLAGSVVANTARSGDIIGDFEVPMGSTHFVGAISSVGGDAPHNNLPRCKDVLYIQKG